MTRRRKFSFAVAAFTAMIVAAATGASAVPAFAGGAPAVAAKKAPSAVSGLSPDERQFVKRVGSAVILNQDALSTFRAWVITRPAISDSGYQGMIDDLAHKTTTVMWYGPRTPFLAAIIREGTRRGIKVSVQARKYSLQQIAAARAAILKQAAAGKWAGFKISATVALTAADGGITVEGTYTAIPAAKRASLVRKLSTTVMGVPVHLAPGHTFSLTDGRDADFSPFNSGGLMVTYHTHNGEYWYCTSGFSIWLNGRSYTTTAAHCDYSDFVDANDGGAPTAPPTSQWYGTAGQKSGDGGALVLGNYGSDLMFYGGIHSTGHSYVAGYEDLADGDLVCTEGGNSGEHCNVKVEALSVTCPSCGLGSLSLIEAYQVNGGLAVVGGDSGGPVMSLKGISEPDVGAAGMIQAAATPYMACGTTYTPPDACSNTVLFTSTRTIVCSISGATLYTTNGDLPCNYPGLGS